MKNYIEQFKEVVEKIAEKPLVKLRKSILTPDLTEENLEDSEIISFTGTICDLTAYSTLACAVGVNRVETLKTKAAGASVGRAADRILQYAQNPRGTNFDDKLWLFYRARNDAQAFETAIQQWMAGKKAGIAQFKFNASGWHTFVVLRLEEQKGFIVYQSYQGVYRLCDYLELEQFNNRQRQPFAPLGYSQQLLQNAKDQVAATTEAFGKHKILSAQDFQDKIVTPFRQALGEGMLRSNYMLISGHYDSNYRVLRFGQQQQQVSSLFLLTFDGLQAGASMELTRLKLANDSAANATAPLGTDEA